jgi:hypothetical protein
MADAGGLIGPALDAGEQAFDSGPIALNDVAGLIRRRVEGLALPAIGAVDQNGDQIFGAGEYEDIGLFRV